MRMEIDENRSEVLIAIIRKVFRIEDIMWGDPKKEYIVRCRGKLLHEDSAAAYDELAEKLKPLDVTPLFRLEDDRHAIVLVEGVIKPRPSNPRTNLILFFFTVISMIVAYMLFFQESWPSSTDISSILDYLNRNIGDSLAFALSLLAILLAHEFGHYLAARYHKTDVSFPYFIPFPFSPFGTMGAFIQLKEPPRNKRKLLDIGIAGPLAGLIVCIPILLIGLSLSPVEPISSDIPAGTALTLEGNSLIYLFAKYIIHGKFLPEPVSYQGVHPFLYWVRYFFTSHPFPEGGLDVLIHPIAWAGWSGLLVTSLNLIPAGQLDGGHVLYVLLGRRVRRLFPFLLGILVLMGLFIWDGWLIWALLVYFIGRIFAEPLDQITQLDPNRKILAIFGLIVFLLVFTPVPMQTFINTAGLP